MIEFLASGRDIQHRLLDFLLSGNLKADRLYHVAVKAYRKPRTTGPNSQCNHINGHCQQVAEYTGHEVSEIKTLSKLRAMRRGYPYDTVLGEVVPWSEARCTTEQAAYLIDELHQIAAELDVKLREG